MNRGSRRLRHVQKILDGASMRPRFMNRGSVASYYFGSSAGSASMRPRFMNRGSPSRLQKPAARPGCFNEAPIHESGK